MMMDQLNTEKTSWKLDLSQMMICLNILDMIIVAASVLEKKMVNFIHKFFYMNARISYKNASIRKN